MFPRVKMMFFNLHLILTCLFLLRFTATLAQSESQPSTSLLTTNIPATFSLDLYHIPNKPINILRFYENCVRAIASESRFPFFDRSVGYYGHDTGDDFFIVPHSASVPRLLHAHVVWAVQRTAEDITRSRRYEEVFGNIFYVDGSGRQDRAHKVGTVAMRGEGNKDAATLVAKRQGEAENGEAEGGENVNEGLEFLGIKDLGAGNATTQVLELNPGYTPGGLAESNGLVINVEYPDAAQNIGSTTILLALIVTLARLAEYDIQAPATIFKWFFADSGAPVSLTFSVSPGYTDEIKNRDLIAVVVFLKSAIVHAKKWTEVDGILAKIVDVEGKEVRREVGRLAWRKIVAPGDDGNKEGLTTF